MGAANITPEIEFNCGEEASYSIDFKVKKKDTVSKVKDKLHNDKDI